MACFSGLNKHLGQLLPHAISGEGVPPKCGDFLLFSANTCGISSFLCPCSLHPPNTSWFIEGILDVHCSRHYKHPPNNLSALPIPMHRLEHLQMKTHETLPAWPSGKLFIQLEFIPPTPLRRSLQPVTDGSWCINTPAPLHLS